MEIMVLGSGSKGNCTILTDKNGNQLMLDCGINIKEVGKVIKDYRKLQGCLCTHSHNDHSAYIEKIRLSGRKIFSPIDGNLTDNKLIYFEDWLAVPIKLIHNVECYGFLVTSRVENKTIAYITDTTYIPNGLPLERLDCLMLEVNYDEEIAKNVCLERAMNGNGYQNHLSLQYVENYFYARLKESKLKNLMVCHTSNSGLLDCKKVLQKLGLFTNNINIASKNLKIEI